MESFYKQSVYQLVILCGAISNVFLTISIANEKYAWFVVIFACVYHFFAYLVLMEWNRFWARHVDSKAKRFLKKNFPEKPVLNIWEYYK